MAVKLRLTRMGSTKRPFYRIVATDAKTKRDGEYLELIGTYDPISNITKINSEVALKWLNVGAIPSDTVKSLFSKEKIMVLYNEGKKKNTVKKEAKETVKKETKKTTKTVKKTTTKKAK